RKYLGSDPQKRQRTSKQIALLMQKENLSHRAWLNHIHILYSAVHVRKIWRWNNKGSRIWIFWQKVEAFYQRFVLQERLPTIHYWNGPFFILTGWRCMVLQPLKRKVVMG